MTILSKEVKFIVQSQYSDIWEDAGYWGNDGEDALKYKTALNIQEPNPRVRYRVVKRTITVTDEVFQGEV